MAFNQINLQVNRGVTTSPTKGSGVTFIDHTYESSTDTLAAIITSGYFPPNFTIPPIAAPNVAPQPDDENIFVNDLLFITGSDNIGLFQITGLNPVTLGANLLTSSIIALAIGAPITATDNNGLVLATNILKAEFADATHNGIVSTAAQSFAGVKTFLNSIFCTAVDPVSPGTALYLGTVTPATQIVLGTNATQATVSGTLNFTAGNGTINNFATFSSAQTWSGPWGATMYTQTMRAYQINTVVTVYIQAVTPATATVSAVATGSAALPVGMRPATPKTYIAYIANNTTPVAGLINISTAGVVTITNIASGAFTGSGTAGFGDISVSFDNTF